MSSKRLKGPDETPADSLVARVRGEYSEMPGLRVTLEQACRLWQLDATTCEKLLNHLVCGGFLYKNESGFYIASSVTRGHG
jgi:hypothetical protein